MYKAAKRVCVIGAGPSGMSALYQFKQLEMKGQEIPEIVCFDKQSDWGGLWKYSWQTGTDEYGEPVHGSMYQGLWTNGPKEAYELPDYTWKEHFGKPVPSYPPREIIYDYLQSRWSKNDLRPWIRFSHVVRQVTYNDSTNDFTVVVKDLSEDKVLPAERFDYVIVASGHFSVPKMPFFPGIDQFPGRVIHSHSFRNASHFKGKRVLIIGSSYSAEDIALQCLKYGAENIICCWRTRPMGFKWPRRITEKPMLTLIEESTVHFKDGSTAEVDDIILCTGYHYSLPFMEESLRLKTDNNLYPEGLYKSILWTRGGNNKVLYIGMQDQSYTFPMFDVQAKWVVNYIMGELKLPGKEEMETDSRSWITRMGELNDVDDRIAFQTAYVAGLVKESNYGYDLDISEMLHAWNKTKLDNITTYRDQSFTSKHTGHKAPLSHTPFMEEFDDSMEHFLKTEQRNL